MNDNVCYEESSSADKVLDLVIAHCGDKIWSGSHEIEWKLLKIWLIEYKGYKSLGTPAGIVELMAKLEKAEELLEKAAEEIENLYGHETELTQEMREIID
jgi:predicted transcriptional regulator